MENPITEMKIYLNQKEIDLPGERVSVADVLAINSLDDKKIAVARANRVVPREAWKETWLEEGDRLVVITAVCGG